MIKKFNCAILQTGCSKIKDQTLKLVQSSVEEAVSLGGQVCILGETFNSIYTKQHLLQNAEDFDDVESSTLQLMKQLAIKNSIYLIGSIPEKEKQSNKLFNTAFCFSPSGMMIAKYRKSHLFDIDIPGKMTYKESETFAPGNQFTVFDTEFGKFGLGICYDIRFPEFSQILRQKGAQMLIYPGSFNQTTGPLHYELLMRARACDNQVFNIGVSPARYTEDPSVYQAWGHSTIVDPYGRVLVKAEQKPVVLMAEIDFSLVDEIRKNIPVFEQRRNDLYQLITKN